MTGGSVRNNDSKVGLEPSTRQLLELHTMSQVSLSETRMLTPPLDWTLPMSTFGGRIHCVAERLSVSWLLRVEY